jgi:hypothetical protein
MTRPTRSWRTFVGGRGEVGVFEPIVEESTMAADTCTWRSRSGRIGKGIKCEGELTESVGSCLGIYAHISAQYRVMQVWHTWRMARRTSRQISAICNAKDVRCRLQSLADRLCVLSPFQTIFQKQNWLITDAMNFKPTVQKTFKVAPVNGMRLSGMPTDMDMCTWPSLMNLHSRSVRLVRALLLKWKSLQGIYK